MRIKGLSLVVGLVAVLSVAPRPLTAQRGAPPNSGDWPLAIANILPFGQPVIPIFESWIPYPDNTILYSFGYINLNSEEVIDIPLGPDNFIEPKKFDGVQPTHFDVAPKDRARFGRHQSVFAVKVPKDYKGDIVWTLRVRGKSYSSPGRATREEYGIEDFESLTESPVAAELKFGPNMAGRGRLAFSAGPVKAVAGTPVPLSVGVDLLKRPSTTVTWYHHQGAGKVTFDPKETVLKANGDAKTMATFSQPGEYVLRVTALESTQAMEQHCCYTNGYVKVSVSR